MPFTTYLVDDDPGVLKSLSRLVRTAGYDIRSYSSSREFLDNHDPSAPGCVILDLMMPEIDGLELQRRLAENANDRPIIFLTGQGDIRTTVAAMKGGAVDFLTKPVKANDLLTAVMRAKERDAAARQTRDEQDAIDRKLATLTAREREVLVHVVAGRLNKQIAAIIGTVEKTVKVHRGRMMAKLGIRSVADLVRLAGRAGIASRG